MRVNKLSRRMRKFYGPPQDVPWVWLSVALIESEAFRSLSINGHRFVMFLLCEHRNHAGRENGNLAAPYDQLQAFGLTRSKISAAVKEAEAVGLVRCVRGGRWAGTNQPSRYRLTFYPGRDGSPATNEWKGIEKRQAREFQRDQSQRKRAHAQWRHNLKNQKAGSICDTTEVRQSELQTPHRGHSQT